MPGSPDPVPPVPDTQDEGISCPDGGMASGAAAITRGVRRALAQRGYASVTEFRLNGGRRADVMAVDADGAVVIVEVKSSVADFRSDRKWPDYRPWCDRFFFAVDEAFPVDLIPADCGLMVADAFGAAVVREAPEERLAAARRKALVLRVALTAAARLHRAEDPGFTADQASV
ncbi:hypothetical protein M2352_002940 [Azospirillum fermentarium]|uniref:MmcB family DNA repair protein n=1 Tax=Azospirillum fermentarium TaxID=1233114 RepID=UPI0029CAC4FF|nr:MmcB family DNA repair protein [Azospirillum fermentarium]MCW2247349.1 hypothetical protein [Azospirillum fermentarium]